MIAPEHLEMLRNAVGANGLQEHEPLELDGLASTLTLSPSDGCALSSVLTALERCSLAALVRAHKRTAHGLTMGTAGCVRIFPARAPWS